MRVAGVLQHGRGQLHLVLVDADGAHVGDVVVVPVALAGTGRALRRHARVVRTAVSRDGRIAAVVGQQRAEHGGVGQQKDAAGVEQDCVKVPYRHRVNITFRCA